MTGVEKMLAITVVVSVVVVGVVTGALFVIVGMFVK